MNFASALSTMLDILPACCAGENVVLSIDQRRCSFVRAAAPVEVEDTWVLYSVIMNDRRDNATVVRALGKCYFNKVLLFLFLVNCVS